MKQQAPTMSQIIQHNGTLAYMYMTHRQPRPGFRILGIPIPMDKMPEFVEFCDPTLIGSVAAND